MFVQSASGLFRPDLYRDIPWITAGWRGNDVVTLFIAVPTLTGALILASRGSLRAQLVWLGVLFYSLYNYPYYLFGAAINSFFPLYVALFASSMSAFILGVASLDVDAITRVFRDRTPVKWISGYMMITSLVMGSLWTGLWMKFVLTGSIPEVGGSEQVFRLIASMDLSLQVTPLAIAASWLWRRRPWGYFAGTILMVADTIYMLVLLAFSPFAASAGVAGAWDQAPAWALFGIGCLISAASLLGSMRSGEGQRHARAA
jgi:hypothetical protein